MVSEWSRTDCYEIEILYCWLHGNAKDWPLLFVVNDTCNDCIETLIDCNKVHRSIENRQILYCAVKSFWVFIVLIFHTLDINGRMPNKVLKTRVTSASTFTPSLCVMHCAKRKPQRRQPISPIRPYFYQHYIQFLQKLCETFNCKKGMCNQANGKQNIKEEHAHTSTRNSKMWDCCWILFLIIEYFILQKQFVPLRKRNMAWNMDVGQASIVVRWNNSKESAHTHTHLLTLSRLQHVDVKQWNRKHPTRVVHTCMRLDFLLQQFNFLRYFTSCMLLSSVSYFYAVAVGLFASSSVHS